MSTKLDWGRQGQSWQAITGPDALRAVKLRVYSDRVEHQCGAETTWWSRADHALGDDIAAMRFAEDRARDLCTRMFGDLLGPPE